MIPIHCYVGRVRSDLETPDAPYVLGGKSISDHLQEGSLGDIQLIIDATRLDQVRIPERITSNEISLNWALGKLLPSIGENEIGLLFADTYSLRQDVFGLMFDLGFNPADGTTVPSDYTREPREGCAVFCDAIASHRPQDERTAEMVFTAIHELGHVFNLWHLDGSDDPRTFMYSSANSNRLLAPPYGFASGEGRLGHQEFLSKCSTWPCVRPRGSRYGDRRMGSVEASHDPAANQIRLRLELELGQEEMWWFEPLELDVKVSVPPGIKKSYKIPDRVDCAYNEFQIWIDSPSGERFRYRSPRRYCGRLSNLEIDVNRPFERDISIFGQAGGYTFSSPGIYKIQALFRIDGRHTLRSNPVEIEVRQPSPRNSDFRRLMETLTDPPQALLLYHRDSLRIGSQVRRLEDFCRAEKASDCAANAAYAVGRVLQNAAQRTSDRSRRRDYQSRSLEHLRSAQEFPRLSSNRRRRAESLTDRLEEDLQE